MLTLRAIFTYWYRRCGPVPPDCTPTVPSKWYFLKRTPNEIAVYQYCHGKSMRSLMLIRENIPLAGSISSYRVTSVDYWAIFFIRLPPLYRQYRRISRLLGAQQLFEYRYRLSILCARRSGCKITRWTSTIYTSMRVCVCVCTGMTFHP